MSAPVLLVVIASTRPGRVGGPVGEWFAELARRDGRFEVDVADLAEIALPMFDEPHHPRLGRYEHDHTLAWAARVERADAVVFVTPEYNHSYPAPLKNALDYLSREWRHLPASFVSYGGVAAGTRAVQALKPVLAVLTMVPAQQAVAIPFVHQHVGEDGRFAAPAGLEETATGMLTELAGLIPVLGSLRRRLPQG